jgi:hypothetical protein
VAVLSDELGNAVLSLACAPRAFDPQHVQLARDIAEGEMGSGHQLLEDDHALLGIYFSFPTSPQGRVDSCS